MLKANTAFLKAKSRGFPSASFTPRRGSVNSSFAKRIKEARQLQAKRRADFKKLHPRQKMMPFSPRLMESVMAGKTTASFRLIIHSCYPKKGEDFIAHCGHNPIPGKYRCLKRVKSTIRKTKARFWRLIGMPSPAAYEDLMKDILNMKDLPMDKEGVLFFFERIE